MFSSEEKYLQLFQRLLKRLSYFTFRMTEKIAWKKFGSIVFVILPIAKGLGNTQIAGLKKHSARKSEKYRKITDYSFKWILKTFILIYCFVHCG